MLSHDIDHYRTRIKEFVKKTKAKLMKSDLPSIVITCLPLILLIIIIVQIKKRLP